MKKKFLTAILVATTVLGLTGCTTSFSYTYDVETGDKVKVTLDTTDGYEISSNVPFEISKDEEVLSEGTFIFADAYEEYMEAIDESDKTVVLDEGNDNGIRYVFWSYDEEIYNYIVIIKGSDTGILIKNEVSEDSARECFKRLEFSIE